MLYRCFCTYVSPVSSKDHFDNPKNKLRSALFPTHSGIKRSAKLLSSTSELSAASDVIFPAILNTQITWSWLLTQEESGCLLKNVSLRLGSRRLSVEESGWLQKKVKSKPRHKGTGWVRRLKKLGRRPLSQPGSYLCEICKDVCSFLCFLAFWLHCNGCYWTHFWVEQTGKFNV